MKQFADTWINFVDSPKGALLRDLGLLLARLGFGGMMAFLHGWPKLAEFEERSGKFPDPLGVGSANSLMLAIFTELFCSLAVTAGFLTRLAAVGLIPTMLIANRVASAGGPTPNSELALVFLIGFTVLIFTGPGRFSLDHLAGRRLSSRG